MISITKSFEFCAAHLLPGHNGMCRNLHGHTYKLDVTICMSVLAIQQRREGMVMDFGDLKKIVNKAIISQLDHSDLNDWLSNPTAEMIVLKIRDILIPAFKKRDMRLSRLRLWESPSSYAQWDNTNA